MRGLGISKGFDKSRKNGWFVCVRQPDGRRPKLYFADERARDQAFAQKLKEVRQYGVPEVVSPSDRQTLAEMKDRASRTGLTILEIFMRGLSHSRVDVRTTIDIAVDELLDEQEKLFQRGQISRPRRLEIRRMLRRYADRNRSRLVAEITRADLRGYLDSLEVAPQTRLNHARALSFFFRWCVAEGYARDNPVPAQRGVDRIPSVFTNAQVDALFDRVHRDFPELLAMLGVQWFAGLRPGASHHLRWEDIDFNRARIMIQPHGNKLRQPDIVRDLPPTVFGLLASVRQPSGPIPPPNHIRRVRELHEALGYGGAGRPRWPEDVARHTFASNLYAHYELDSRRVEAVLLHSSSAMLRKHYLLKNIPAEDAAAYFARYVPSA